MKLYSWETFDLRPFVFSAAAAASGAYFETGSAGIGGRCSSDFGIGATNEFFRVICMGDGGGVDDDAVMEFLRMADGGGAGVSDASATGGGGIPL